MVVIYKIISSYLCKINLSDSGEGFIPWGQFMYDLNREVFPKESWHVVSEDIPIKGNYVSGPIS